ncbi:MAG: hypothetical protein QF828_06920 [Pseudomonadales bacterium]|nr:hypothetical protein [Pseudomonadales bacterium]HJN52706.1 hypothetical protein [Pseudomonadales bacterium]
MSLMICVSVQGCRISAPEPTSVPVPEPESVLQPLDQERLAIEELLLEAADALAQNRLTTPAEDCAYYRYLSVLALDPGNREALQGIHDIVEKYLDWAIRDANENNFRRAESYLNKARTVDETHPNIDAVAEQIAQKSNARIMTYRLSTEGLNIRASWITDELVDIGTEVQQQNATVVITARSDAEARWIYQQLNHATGDVRVRAEVKMGAIPSVRLIYPATPDN